MRLKIQTFVDNFPVRLTISISNLFGLPYFAPSLSLICQTIIGSRPYRPSEAP